VTGPLIPIRTTASPQGGVRVAPPAGSGAAASAGKGRPTTEMHNPSRGTGAPGWAPRCNWCRWLTTLCVDPAGHAEAMDYYAWWRAAAAARWARR
jgi:hypothetical protein